MDFVTMLSGNNGLQRIMFSAPGFDNNDQEGSVDLKKCKKTFPGFNVIAANCLIFPVFSRYLWSGRRQEQGCPILVGRNSVETRPALSPAREPGRRRVEDDPSMAGSEKDGLWPNIQA
jgi:hypothetical protein